MEGKRQTRSLSKSEWTVCRERRELPPVDLLLDRREK